MGTVAGASVSGACYAGGLAPSPKGLPPPEAQALSEVAASATQRTSSPVAARRTPFEGASPRKGVALRLGNRAPGTIHAAICPLLPLMKDRPDRVEDRGLYPDDRPKHGLYWV